MAQSLKEITNEAIAALQSGNNARALEISCRAVKSPQAGHLQRLVFTMAFEKTTVPSLAGELKKALELTLGQPDIDNQRLFPGWYYIFSTSPSYQILSEETEWGKLEQKLQDKFLIEGLRNLNFLDWPLEQIMTRLRRNILLDYWPKGLVKTKHLPFLCALAEHCFYNEYVMVQTEEEAEAIEKIDTMEPVSVALLGCYKPLADVVFTERMSAVAGFRSMARTHATNVRRERAIRNTLGSSQLSDVSGRVQAMYEENPYPRWTSINLPHAAIKDIQADILLAGCGTGQTATGMASALPECHFTAIDLSRVSISYAMRMAEQYGIENVRFRHLDILQAETLHEKFDYIECSGVLHHMKDPEAGWRVLSSCLKEGGGMQVALYSRKTRSEIDAVRDYIDQKGYKPVPADIRRLRTDIAAFSDDSPLKEVLRMRDFYSMSMVRDLVFHIQETSYTIADLALMMERLGLVFDGFKLSRATQAAYRAKFPDDPQMTNLTNWDAFENENPQTFIGMYRIFCHKKGEIPTDDVVRIREMQA